MRISSRNALRIFLIGTVPAIVAWRLAYVERLERWLLARRPVVPSSCAVGRRGDGPRGFRGGRAIRQSRGGGVRSVRLHQRVGVVGTSYAAPRCRLRRQPAVAGRREYVDAARVSHQRRWRDGADLRARHAAADGGGSRRHGVWSVSRHAACGALLVFCTFDSAGGCSIRGRRSSRRRCWRAARFSCSCR